MVSSDLFYSFKYMQENRLLSNLISVVSTGSWFDTADVYFIA